VSATSSVAETSWPLKKTSGGYAAASAAAIHPARGPQSRAAMHPIQKTVSAPSAACAARAAAGLCPAIE
jgi:hypothetical protein